jgi:hypothetical protein
VNEDGIGLQGAAEAVRPGLGASIVEALTRPLAATVLVESGRSGARVTITLREAKPAGRDAGPIDAARGESSVTQSPGRDHVSSER